MSKNLVNLCLLCSVFGNDTKAIPKRITLFYSFLTFTLFGGGYRSRTDDPPAVKRDCFSLVLTFTLFGGGYRSRTDDPLRARQVL